MQHLEVSAAVRLTYMSLGFKVLNFACLYIKIEFEKYVVFSFNDACNYEESGLMEGFSPGVSWKK